MESCYNYGIHGTGFFLKYGDKVLFLTARHNFEKSSIFKNFALIKNTLESFFIIREFNGEDLKHPESRVPFSNIYFPSVPPNILGECMFTSYDTNDIAVFTIDDKYDSPILTLPFRPKLSGVISMVEDDTEVSNSGDRLIIIGYPSCCNGYNYDDEKNLAYLKLEKRYLSGLCLENKFGIGECSVKEDNDIESYDGFSGSPIFKLNDDGNLTLTGMVIRGTKISKKIIYITIERIYLYLMGLDISVMLLGYAISDEGLEGTVEHLRSLEINVLHYNKDNIQIELDNEEKVTLTPAHRFAFQALYLLKQGEVELSSENLQIVQDFIVIFSPKFKSENIEESDNLISFLTKNIITMSTILIMKELLHDASTEDISKETIIQKLGL